MRINRINIVQALLLLSMSNKVKEALRTRLSGNKISWTETFVRSRKIAKWKTTLNRETSACYENLPIKTYLKKMRNLFLRVTVTPLSSKSVASGIYTAFPQITQKTLITDTCHWLEPITVILGFWKYSLLEKQSLISELLFFLKIQGSNFQVQFWMNCVFPLMPIISSWEDSSCVWTAIQAGWLSPILFYTRKQSDEYWLPVKLKWGRTNVCQKL